MAGSDEPAEPATSAHPSLCHSCSFVRTVSGRLGQAYFLCTNAEIAAKYPEQPRLECPGYTPAGH